MAKPVKPIEPVEPTKINNPINGLIEIMGGHDTGKTAFAFLCGAHPKRIAFIDDDEKGYDIVRQLGGSEAFGLYVDLVEEFRGKREADQHKVVLSIVENIERMGKEGQLDAVIWDTWTRAGKVCHYYAIDHAAEFRSKFSANPVIAGAERNALGNVYEAEIINRLVHAVQLVFVVFHLREQRVKVSDGKGGGKSVLNGRFEADARASFDRISNMRIWLEHNPDGTPIPYGLFVKRPAKYMIDPETNRPILVNYLPRKITPLTWEKILWYWNNPVLDRAPTEDEMPNEYDLSVLDGTLTPSQRKLYEASLSAINAESAVDLRENSMGSNVFALPSASTNTIVGSKAGQLNGRDDGTDNSDTDDSDAIEEAIRLAQAKNR